MLEPEPCVTGGDVEIVGVLQPCWELLGAERQAAACMLGWTATTWNEGGLSAVLERSSFLVPRTRSWSELNHEQRVTLS